MLENNRRSGINPFIRIPSFTDENPVFGGVSIYTAVRLLQRTAETPACPKIRPLLLLIILDLRIVEIIHIPECLL